MIENINKKQKTESHKYIKPPTLDELNKFREVQFLQHSNLFRLQIDEMLTALEIKTSNKVKINTWFNEFSTFVKALPKSKSIQINNYKSIEENGIKIPIPTYPKLPDVDGAFIFVPPNEVSMVGSFPLGLATTHCKIIDIAFILPKEFMQKNDLHNGKWLIKRALYLSKLGKALQTNTDLVSSLSWTQHCGSLLRPILQVIPSGKLGQKWAFNIFPVPPEDFFKVTKVAPNRNNVSPSWFFARDEKDGETLPPTPHYNWLCGVDIVMMNHFNFIKSNLTHSNWIQGLKLLKVWLSQRGFNEGEGAISSHLMTLYVIYLAKNHKLSFQMSVFQVFRTTLLHISQTDWHMEGPMLERDVVKGRNLVSFESKDLVPYFPVIFIDHSGVFNIAGNVLKELYLQLVHESNVALEILELSSTNSFEALFIRKMEFSLAFDKMVRIAFNEENLKQILSNKENSESVESVLLDHLGDFRMKVFSLVVSTLTYGLGERVDLIGICRGQNITWEYDSLVPELNYNLTLGVLVNPRTFTGLLTKGPSADTKEAIEFKNFWGEISSLRRFKDSTFHEAVLWLENLPPISFRRKIITKIVEHIIEKQFCVKEKCITCISTQLEDPLARNYHYFEDDKFVYGSGEESLTAAIISFDKLAKKLRALDLPLKVTGIQSPSEVLRQTMVFPPLPMKVSKPFIKKNQKREEIVTNKTRKIQVKHQLTQLYRSSMEVQIFLEISGKWPDNLVAINGIKNEFLRKIADLLREDGITAVVFRNHLKVIWEGYAFNIKICYWKEILLLRGSAEDEESETARVDTPASISLEKEIGILPKLTSSLSSLQSDFPSFNGSVRLVKRWVSAQLLIPHFPPVAIELLVAYLFLSPHPYKPPNTPQVALIRFWSLVSTTDWKSTPILVNLRKEFDANDENELTERFTNHRVSFPPLFICSPCELKPLLGGENPSAEDLNRRYKLASCWSVDNPTLPILGRMQVVAKSALNTFLSSVWKEDFDFITLFRPPYDPYDALIHLDILKIERRNERLDCNKKIMFRPYEHAKGEILPLIQFERVQFYLRDLRATYDRYALFFHDEHGGNVIGVLFKPNVTVERELKLPNVEGHKLTGVNDIKFVVNLDTIIEEFKALGEGLVEKIDLKS